MVFLSANSNYEIRNSKQKFKSENSNVKKRESTILVELESSFLVIRILVIEICFAFRYSDFGFIQFFGTSYCNAW